MTVSKGKGTIGVVVRVSDVKGRDKKGDRFISPDEQVRVTTAYCRADGYEVQVQRSVSFEIACSTATRYGARL
jgi:hypothetical protein